MANLYAVVGQGYIADGTGTTDSTRRLVPGVNDINITGAGNLTVTMCSGTSAVAASDVATVTLPLDGACPQGAATTITVVGTGNIHITVTYDSTANYSSHYTWATSSGGAPNSNGAEPTSSDNIFMDSKSFTAGSQVLTVDATASCLSMDWTGATNTPTLTLGTNNIQIYGNCTLISAMTTSASNNYLDFSASGCNLTSNGKTISFGVRVGYSVLATLTILDTFNCGGYTIILGNSINSVLNTNNQTITCGNISSNYTNARTLTLGSSIINCTSFGSMGTGLVLTANTSTINCSGNFSGGSLTTYNIVNLTGATSTVTGNNQIKVLGFTRADVQTITFTDASTQAINYWTRDAGTSLKTLTGSGNGGWKLVKLGGIPISMDYISVSKSKVFPPQTWYAGVHSRNGGNNVGWNFGNKARRSDSLKINR